MVFPMLFGLILLQYSKVRLCPPITCCLVAADDGVGMELVRALSDLPAPEESR